MLEQQIKALQEKQELTFAQIQEAADFLLDADAGDDLKATFLTLLTAKGETPAEIAAFVECFLEYSLNPHFRLLDLSGPSLDIVGTGGDKLNLFNVSTTSMFVAVGAGAVVTKHGNRGMTSKSGGADVLEALGVPIELPPDEFRECVEKCRCGFVFAPVYHPSFKVVAPVRQRLGKQNIRTIFNLLGPLMNPVRPECQLIGVPREEMAPVFAEILQRLGRSRAWVVSGKTADGRGVDEVSLMGPTTICSGGLYLEHKTWEICPEDFGLETSELEPLVGGDALVNAKIMEGILSGKDRGPRRDIILLNSACAIASAGLAPSISAGVIKAMDSISSGEALGALRRLQAFGKSVRHG